MVYDISYKALIDAKSFCVRFDKIDGFIRVYDGTRYLVLFWAKKKKRFHSQQDYISYSSKKWYYMFSLIVMHESKLIHTTLCP